MYSVEGLREGIRRCKINKKALQDAIAREENTIKEYKIMISDIERAEKRKAEAEANIHIEVDNDSTH